MGHEVVIADHQQVVPGGGEHIVKAGDLSIGSDELPRNYNGGIDLRILANERFGNLAGGVIGPPDSENNLHILVALEHKRLQSRLQIADETRQRLENGDGSFGVGLRTASEVVAKEKTGPQNIEEARAAQQTEKEIVQEFHGDP
jgi:hypothetical protein